MLIQYTLGIKAFHLNLNIQQYKGKLVEKIYGDSEENLLLFLKHKFYVIHLNLLNQNKSKFFKCVLVL